MTTTENTPPSAPVKGGTVPYLQVDGAMKAVAFYQRAFGATLAAVHPVDDTGRTMHAHVYVNGSSVMLNDAYPEHGHPLQAPQAFSLVLVVDDIDGWWARAVEAGAAVVMPVAEMFWGDRFGQLRDPFGVLWSMNQPKR